MMQWGKVDKEKYSNKIIYLKGQVSSNSQLGATRLPNESHLVTILRQ
jgi:hypothetical protein